MYSLTVSDHIMVAHSFKGDIFGPAQKVHGATFVIEWEIRRAQLDGDGLIVDIGLMRAVLRRVLERIDYRNLDDVAQFKGRNTTTEFLAKHLFDQFAEEIRMEQLGPGTARVFAGQKITLRESPVAWAAFEGTL